jgi:hypothetical protein
VQHEHQSLELGCLGYRHIARLRDLHPDRPSRQTDDGHMECRLGNIQLLAKCGPLLAGGIVQMTDYRTQIIAISEKIGNMRGFNPSDELARAIEDAGRSAKAGDQELYQAAHRIMAHMNRERLLSGERAAI